MWIDKFCIDQTNIKEDLSCLPIFLAGCNNLLILRGDTYLQRLWCIVEIYCFLELQDDVTDLENTVQVLEVGSDLSPISKFDAAACGCFDPNDKVNMLSCIEAGCESIDAFNTKVSVMLGVVAGSIDDESAADSSTNVHVGLEADSAKPGPGKHS